MAETAAAAQTATAPPEQVFFRATEYGITDGAIHYANEVFPASPAIVAHYERTGGVLASLGRTLYVPATATEYEAQERHRLAEESAATPPPPPMEDLTPQVQVGGVGMVTNQVTAADPASRGEPLL